MAATLLVILAGCNPRTRHRFLTYFFDGVPPFVTQQGSRLGDPTTLLDPNATGGLNPDMVTSWRSRHEPVRDCTRCHVDGMQWDRKQFKRPLPQLCYECHTNYGLATGHLHGPVAVGSCLHCHEPHQSKYPNLLRSQAPKLCYQCHQESDILSIASHQKVDPTRCNKCHDPHISPLRKLLKIHADDTKSINSSSPDELEVTE